MPVSDKRESAGSPDTLALYVHWPFCLSKCPYCDFNSHVRDRVDHGAWHAALLSELNQAADRIGPRRLTSIFFGGGTPSLAEPETIGAVIEAAKARWRTADDLEVTLEANPTSVETDRLRAVAEAGVNRLSLGVQSLDNDALRFLGRRHDTGEALKALETAARLFPRFSFDLIYALPDQTPAAWAAQLDQALARAGDHLSLYQLTIEPGTAFHTAHRLGQFTIPDEATGEALYDLTQERLETAGMPAYEISNHARPGAESRHNLSYWRSDDYVGIGPGAHGRVTIGGERRAQRRVRLPEKWLARVQSDGAAMEEETALSQDDAIRECLLMGLRLSEGIDAAQFQRRFRAPLEQSLDGARLKPLLDEGLLLQEAGALRTTPAGRKRLNAVLSYLLA